MSIYDAGYGNLRDHAKRYGVSSIPEETEFGENFDVTADYMKQEMLSTSEGMMIGDQVKQAATLYRDTLKDSKGKSGGLELGNVGIGLHETNKQFLEDNHQSILDLQSQYPDAGFRTIDDIKKDAQERARITRDKMSKTTANASGMGTLGYVAGGMYGVLHDPILLGSMLLGTGKITGLGKLGNAWKAFNSSCCVVNSV